MMTPARRASRPRRLRGWLALTAVLVGCTGGARAQATPDFNDGPSSKTEILNVMQDVRRKYGSDAVMLQGHLMSHAVRNGAVGETVSGVDGFEDRDGKRFVIFRLETGIIYNDRELDTASRPARAWTDIIEASLRTFHTLALPGDGIVLRLAYAHRGYDSEAELRTHLREQPGTPETAVFYLMLPDVGDLLSDRITGQQLIERSTTLVNGTAARVSLAAPTPDH